MVTTAVSTASGSQSRKKRGENVMPRDANSSAVSTPGSSSNAVTAHCRRHSTTTPAVASARNGNAASATPGPNPSSTPRTTTFTSSLDVADVPVSPSV